MKDEREIVAWGSPDADSVYDDFNDALEMILDGMFGDLPETIEIGGFAQRVPTIRPGSILENVLESLDDEYAHDDVGYSEPTKKMQEAEAEFIKVVLSEYTVTTVEQVTSETVNVKEWIKENAPEWLDEA